MKNYIKYLLALILFGSNGTIANYIGLSSYEIVFLRSLLGSILLVGIFFGTRQKITLFRYKKDVFYIALSGIAMAADWLLLFEAYKQIGVSLGMIINYCGPAIVIAFSALLFKERVTLGKLTALITAIMGVFLISGQAAFGGIKITGLICAFLSAFSYSAMVIFNKMSTQIKGLENATLQLFFAFITIAVFVGCKQGFYIDVSVTDWIPVLWIGLVNTGVCCYLYFSSISCLPVQTVALCGYLEPLSAVLLSVVFLHETMMSLQIVGAVLIIGGAIIGEFLVRKNRVKK